MMFKTSGTTGRTRTTTRVNLNIKPQKRNGLDFHYAFFFVNHFAVFFINYYLDIELEYRSMLLQKTAKKTGGASPSSTILIQLLL